MRKILMWVVVLVALATQTVTPDSGCAAPSGGPNPIPIPYPNRTKDFARVASATITTDAFPGSGLIAPTRSSNPPLVEPSIGACENAIWN